MATAKKTTKKPTQAAAVMWSHSLRLEVERATTVDEDDHCEVFVDGRKVAVIGLAGVVGEMQIVAFGPDGIAEAKARRELSVTIGGGA